MKPVFLDRDGVIVRDSDDYLRSAEALEPLPGAMEALVRLARAGAPLIVVSNQQGVSLGYFPESELSRMEARIQSWLEPHGVRIARFEYATALADSGDRRRKPEPGMLVDAAETLRFDLRGCFLIGDRESDMGAALACGVRPLLILTGKTRPDGWRSWSSQPEAVFPTLAEAADFILGEAQKD